MFIHRHVYLWWPIVNSKKVYLISWFLCAPDLKILSIRRFSGVWAFRFFSIVQVLPQQPVVACSSLATCQLSPDKLTIYCSRPELTVRLCTWDAKETGRLHIVVTSRRDPFPFLSSPRFPKQVCCYTLHGFLISRPRFLSVPATYMYILVLFTYPRKRFVLHKKGHKCLLGSVNYCWDIKLSKVCICFWIPQRRQCVQNKSNIKVKCEDMLNIQSTIYGRT